MRIPPLLIASTVAPIASGFPFAASATGEAVGGDASRGPRARGAELAERLGRWRRAALRRGLAGQFRN